MIIKMEKLIFVFLALFIHGLMCILNDGKVVHLNISSFPQIVHRSSTLWVIEYYASWCGHCQQFAPIYSSLATDIQGWDNIVKLGAVSCPDSAALCFLHAVHGYPSLKFFFPNSTEESIGEKYNGEKELEAIRLAIINKTKELLENENIRYSWPYLDYYRDLSLLWTVKTNRVYIIVEGDDERNSFIGEMVILDTNKLRPHVMVGRIMLRDAGSPDVKKSGLYSLSKTLSFSHIDIKFERKAISNYLNSVPPPTSTTTPHLPLNTHQTRLTSPKLDMLDLKSNLLYTLHYEIPLKMTKLANNYATLEKYLHLLVKYHPDESGLKEMLRSLHSWFALQKAPLSVDVWLQKIKALQAEYNIEENISWHACKGSENDLRGFPCSLWMTMHVLVANSYKAERNNSNFSQVSILLILRDFIIEFFTCSDCATNFESETRHWLTYGANMQRPSDVVLQLWRVHNSVNRRLHASLMEDSAFPKYQFPTNADCPACRTEGSRDKAFDMEERDWNEEAVLAFLLNFYASPKLATSAAKITNCSLIATAWSECSKSCDSGISNRLSNQNSDCRLKIESRVCMLRPCNMKIPLNYNNEQNCREQGHTLKLKRSMSLSYANCTSKSQHRFTVCGNCSKWGAFCCRPTHSYSKTLRFGCRLGNVTMETSLPVEFIQKCKCSAALC